MNAVLTADSFPTHPDALTPAFLSNVLGTGVEALHWERIGDGYLGDCVRIRPRYARGEGAGPRTLAAKFTATSEGSRQTALAFGFYAKEMRFYQEVARKLDVRAPHAYFAAANADGTECCLIGEDMAPTRQGDQLAGCSLADARPAIRQAAAIHGPSWRRSDILENSWLPPRTAFAPMLSELYPQAQQIFGERYAGLMEPELMAVCEDFVPLASRWFALDFDREALVHGDFRLDNMLFDIKGGTEPIAILDWQTIVPGNPLIDIGYFLGSGVGPALRKAHEGELLDLYRDEMAKYGVNFQVSAFQRDYALGALHGLATAVFCAAYVERSERGDACFLSMARGAASLALEHGSLQALADYCES